MFRTNLVLGHPRLKHGPDVDLVMHVSSLSLLSLLWEGERIFPQAREIFGGP